MTFVMQHFPNSFVVLKYSAIKGSLFLQIYIPTVGIYRGGIMKSINIGFIVGTFVSIILLIVGIIILLYSSNKTQKNKWAWWLIIFGACALISGSINSGILLK